LSSIHKTTRTTISRRR